jgi:hypothetical protein
MCWKPPQPDFTSNTNRQPNGRRFGQTPSDFFVRNRAKTIHCPAEK